MNYQQLTEGQRYQIDALLAQSLSVSEIAKAIKVHRSTIYRELKRNRLSNQYQANVAHELSHHRRCNTSKYRVPERSIDLVEYGLSLDWSPEQISNVGKLIGRLVSHEWIYRYIAADKAQGGVLYKSLRQGHKRYRRGKNGKRSPILNAISIDDRPDVVENRERLGDWEADTVIGKQGTGVLVTLAERKSRLYLVKRVENKSAAVVGDAIVEMLKPYIKHVHTITFDNGGEFAGHQAIAEALDADVYFAHPYSSWERGLNENFNGLLRQYIPKGRDMRTVSDEEVARAVKQLNLRPRKCLGYKQPEVVFNELAQAA